MMPLRAKKRLGQHFLHDPAVIGKIVTAIAPGRQDLMVEIGGGRGALTVPLLEHVESLHVVELDERMVALLTRACPNSERLIVHHANALKFDFAALAGDEQSLRIVGNLPYNISTPLLFHLLSQRASIQDMHLMLQKEVARRMTARPGGKDYGRLTVMVALWAEIQTCFDIGPGAFSPPPKVRSTLVRVTPQTEPRFPVDNEERFSELVARLFSMRRKTLGRTLRGWLSPEQIASVGIDPGARPETLHPEAFARLANLPRAP